MLGFHRFSISIATSKKIWTNQLWIFITFYHYFGWILPNLYLFGACFLCCITRSSFPRWRMDGCRRLCWRVTPSALHGTTTPCVGGWGAEERGDETSTEHQFEEVNHGKSARNGQFPLFWSYLLTMVISCHPLTFATGYLHFLLIISYDIPKETIFPL
jgi:hypothetical protein